MPSYLPPELLHQILTHALETYELEDLYRLRAVSRFFSTQIHTRIAPILEATFHKQLKWLWGDSVFWTQLQITDRVARWEYIARWVRIPETIRDAYIWSKIEGGEEKGNENEKQGGGGGGGGCVLGDRLGEVVAYVLGRENNNNNNTNNDDYVDPARVRTRTRQILECLVRGTVLDGPNYVRFLYPEYREMWWKWYRAREIVRERRGWAGAGAASEASEMGEMFGNPEADLLVARLIGAVRGGEESEVRRLLATTEVQVGRRCKLLGVVPVEYVARRGSPGLIDAFLECAGEQHGAFSGGEMVRVAALWGNRPGVDAVVENMRRRRRLRGAEMETLYTWLREAFVECVQMGRPVKTVRFLVERIEREAGGQVMGGLRFEGLVMAIEKRCRHLERLFIEMGGMDYGV